MGPDEIYYVLTNHDVRHRLDPLERELLENLIVKITRKRILARNAADPMCPQQRIVYQD